MTCNKLYYYRRFRAAQAVFVLMGVVLAFCAVFAFAAAIYGCPAGVITCVCGIVFAVFVMSIKMRDAEHYYQRAFPEDELRETKL